MDDDPLQYSRHARDRLMKYHLEEDDVRAVVLWPSRRVVTADAVEHDGWASDGREIKVVTDRSKRLVITVVDFERRRRDRRHAR
ncbi:MAG TPA: hypothetical protein VFB22_17090 [Candidatus Baltobacteraceae bacterium]|nr:hypothetical protein [Candidatus Baltobacteraceae bacterium]